MRIHALAVDYDGTIAERGEVTPEARDALERARASGRRLILVTGRSFDDLLSLDPELKLYDAVVAENGAVLYLPESKELAMLAEAAPDELFEELQKRGVPVQRGRVIIATHTPHELEVLETIRDLAMEREVIFNKGAVMVLPSGTNKHVGLQAALDRLGISIHNTAAIGDAENDHSFLAACEISAAVGNALPVIKERADLVMKRANGRGVAELVDGYVLDDFEDAQDVLNRHTIEIGVDRSGESVRVRVHQGGLLLVGSSKSGKSRLSGTLVERLIDQGYQVCIIDPEGEYAEIDPLIMVGNEHARPMLDEVKAALERSPAGVAVNIVALSQAEKVQFAPSLLSMIFSLRASIGRPHWVIIDEAHHLLPDDATPAAEIIPSDLDRFFLVSLEPDRLAPAFLERVTTLFIMGDDVKGQVERFAKLRGLSLPKLGKKLQSGLLDGEVLVVPVKDGGLGKPNRFEPAARRSEHRRHLRKYSAGDVGPDRSFYFRGPHGRLNLRAFNATVFVEMARGVDDETWQFHLQRGDFSRWFEDILKSKQLAKDAREVEARAQQLRPAESRERIARLVESRFTVG